MDATSALGQRSASGTTGGRFAPDERALLLATAGIGPGVVRRLEAAGIHSLAQIRTLGARATVLRVCEHLGTMAWANRQRALSKALRAVGLAGS